MQPLSIERDVRRNGIRMDCVFEGTAFDTAREQVRTLRLSGTKLSQIAEQTGMPVEQVMDYCRELGLPEIGSCHLVPPNADVQSVEESSGRVEEVRRENIVRMSAMPNMNEGIINGKRLAG